MGVPSAFRNMSSMTDAFRDTNGLSSMYKGMVGNSGLGQDLIGLTKFTDVTPGWHKAYSGLLKTSYPYPSNDPFSSQLSDLYNTSMHSHMTAGLSNFYKDSISFKGITQSVLDKSSSFNQLYKTFNVSDVSLGVSNIYDELTKSLSFESNWFKDSSILNDSFLSAGIARKALKKLSVSDIVEQTNHLSFKRDGALFYDNTEISSDEIRTEIAEFFQKFKDVKSIDHIEKPFSALKKPIKSIVIWILNHILVAFIVGLSANLVLQNINKIENVLVNTQIRSKRDVTQCIKKLPIKFQLDNFSEYRVVTGNGLHLRKKPKMDSKILDELDRGKLVKLLQKKRNWSYVEVFYQDDLESLKGWVVTRHITKLKR